MGPHNIEVVAQVLLDAFSQLYSENQGKISREKRLKNLESSQKTHTH